MIGSPRLRKRLIVGAASVLAFYAAASVVVAWFIVHPKYRRPARSIEGAAGLEALVLKTADGLAISASILEAEDPPSGTLLLFHGLGACRQTWRMAAFAKRGFRTMALDFRGHGESGGRITTFGFLERQEVEAAVALARARWPGSPLAAMGSSLGGAALIFASETTRGLDAVILESVYARIDDAYERRIRAYAPSWLVFTGALPRWIASRWIGLGLDTLRPLDEAGKLSPATCLLVTGELDFKAPPSDVEALLGRLPGARTHIVPGAGHDDLWEVAGNAYADVVAAFLEDRFARKK